MDSRVYKIALTMVPGLGCKTCRQLVKMYHTPEAIFSLSHNELIDLFGNHAPIIQSIESRDTLRQAADEVAWIDRYGIRLLFCTDDEYPRRLNDESCSDTPVTLYIHGPADLNNSKIISVVGSRKATQYGKEITDKLISELSGENVLVTSGLAYGIDTAAHTAALKYGLPTAAVLGHGLDQIYPPENRRLAQQIITSGGALVTEYRSHTRIAAGNFPARNRIVAAMCDAVIVVEAAEKGGALITANIADSYHRDVFAVPGRLTDPMSMGCNNLITRNHAYILRNTDDLYYVMNWRRQNGAAPYRHNSQQELFATLGSDEQLIYDLLKKTPDLTIDEIIQSGILSPTKISTAIMNMEFKNVLTRLPGKIYHLLV